MSVKIEHVDVKVAVRRMYIYARTYSMCERDTMAHTILTGGTVTYAARDTDDKLIGWTRVSPEDNPVTLVTEENF